MKIMNETENAGFDKRYSMSLQKELINLLQLAYSAEKAAAFAYQGHAGSVKDAKIGNDSDHRKRRMGTPGGGTKNNE